MSLSLNLGQKSGTDLSNSLLPEQTNLNTWLTQPTTDGKTLVNVKGTDATVTGTNCLSFDGTDNKITIDSLGSFNTTAWTVKFNFTTHSSLASEGNILGQEAGTGTARLWLRILGVGSGKLGRVVTFLGGSGEIQLAPDSTIVANTNYDFELIYNGSGSLQLKTTTGGTTTTHSAVSITVEAASGSLIFGDSHVGGQVGIAGKASSFELISGTDSLVKLPLAEGSGLRAFDISGNGNHATITGASYSTLDGIASHNNENGFDKDIFLGYEGYWDLVAAGSGTFQANANNLTLTGNTGVSGKLRQHVNGLVSGDTLVVSGTVVQTGATGGSNQDVAISSASAGWSESSVFLGGEIGTYTFSTTLNANSSTCDIQFVVLNAANITISDLKFIVVKKIPALINKTKQAITLDGSNDVISFGSTISVTDFVYTSKFKLETTAGNNNVFFSSGSDSSSAMFMTLDGSRLAFQIGSNLIQNFPDGSGDGSDTNQRFIVAGYTTSASQTGSVNLRDGNVHTVVLTRSGTTIAVDIDDGTANRYIYKYANKCYDIYSIW